MCRFIPQIDLESCEFLNFRLSIRSQPCPHCQQTNFVKAHGYVRTSNNSDHHASSIRAIRFMCSPRTGDLGCGRTFTIHWDHIVPRCSLDSTQVSQIIETMATNSKNSAISKLTGEKQWGFSTSTGYRWRKRFSKHFTEIRSALCSKVPPSKELYSTSPEAVTLKHLQAVFPETSCLVAAFQSTFQKVFGQVSFTRFPRCHGFIQPVLNLFRAATRDENQWPLFEARELPTSGLKDPKNHFW